MRNEEMDVELVASPPHSAQVEVEEEKIEKPLA